MQLATDRTTPLGQHHQPPQRLTGHVLHLREIQHQEPRLALGGKFFESGPQGTAASFTGDAASLQGGHSGFSHLLHGKSEVVHDASL